MSLSQFGTHVKPADALRVASSIFSEGVTHLHAGRLAEALANFEASLSMNQNFLQPAALESINCYHQIASVHDKLGNLSEAASYYERARAQLASAPIPPGERGVFAKRRRNELLKQVQQRLDMMPRITQVPKVGAGVPLADLRKLYDSLLSSGDQQLAAGDLSGAELAFEQALALCRTHHKAIALGSGSGAEGSAEMTNAAAVAVSDCLSRLAEVHQRNGQVMVAEAHIVAAIDVLTGDVLADDRGLSNEQGPLSPMSLRRHALQQPPQGARAAAPQQQEDVERAEQREEQAAEAPEAAASHEPLARDACSVSAAAAAIEAAFDDSDDAEEGAPLPATAPAAAVGAGMADGGECARCGSATASAATNGLPPPSAPPPPSTPLQGISARARAERLQSLRNSLRSLHASPAYRRATHRMMTPQRGHGIGGGRLLFGGTPPQPSPLSQSKSAHKQQQPAAAAAAGGGGGAAAAPPPHTPSAIATAVEATPPPPLMTPPPHSAATPRTAATTGAVATPGAHTAPGSMHAGSVRSVPPPPSSAGAASSLASSAPGTPDAHGAHGGHHGDPNLQNAACSLAVAAQSAAEAVGAAVAAQQAADALVAQPSAAEPVAAEERAAAAEKPEAVTERTEGAADATEDATEARSKEEEEDEFAWRKDQGSDESEDDGPVDERVEGAIERINVERDEMTTAQLSADDAQRVCAAAEAHTKGELERLEGENAAHLAKLAEYEAAKSLAAEAQQAADDAVAKHGKAGAEVELAELRRAQGESMQMAMELASTFEALVPYFVYRTVLEQGLEEKRQAVGAAKEAVRVARRRYNQAMEDLETISREIMEAKQRRKEEALAAKKRAEEEAAAKAADEAAAAEAAINAAAEEEAAAKAAAAAEALSPGGGGSSNLSPGCRSVGSSATPDAKGLNAIPTSLRSPSVVAALNGAKYLGRPSRERGVKRL